MRIRHKIDAGAPGTFVVVALCREADCPFRVLANDRAEALRLLEQHEADWHTETRGRKRHAA